MYELMIEGNEVQVWRWVGKHGRVDRVISGQVGVAGIGMGEEKVWGHLVDR